MLLVTTSQSVSSVDITTAAEQDGSESALTTAHPVVNGAEEETGGDDDVCELHDSANDQATLQTQLRQISCEPAQYQKVETAIRCRHETK